ncbi:MAG: DUF2235 domain-containing protein [Halomonas sp.]|nr:DUF2235 domain-containing protein [Halomonas sp.]MDN6298407.1 DUF2235 domain-containing protein [Halomonas sp.]
MKKKRLILLFDGTWDDPENQTNVFRIAQRVHAYDGDVEQRFFYHPGVGSGNLASFMGGIFGYGLSQNLLEGYEWLAKRYTGEDEIWLFGFSRGAYTARSLVGLIRKCGLLRLVTPGLLDKAERLYRDKNLTPEGEECEAFRRKYSRTPRVHFIGVWDTVGALGVPGTNLSESKYSWRDTELSGAVNYAYHAVALDEHRAAYDVSLWVNEDRLKKAPNRGIEQRWFIGAHANVGGGYGDGDALADIPLQWMIEKASSAGLKLDAFNAAGDAWQTRPRDSYGEFLHGAYALFRQITHPGTGRYVRHFARGLNGKPAVNVTVDPSVWRRWEAPKFTYRPRTLTDAGREPPE